MSWLIEMFQNPFLLTPLSSWAVAQVLKTIIHAIIHKKFDILRLVGDGGMPSGHSATVSSLAVFCGFYYGTGSFQFAVTMILAIIVCHDAMGVRLETGKQAVVLNELIETLNTLEKSLESMSKGEFSDVKLKEFVGHTPIQVLAGILVGALNAVVMYYIFI